MAKLIVMQFTEFNQISEDSYLEVSLVFNSSEDSSSELKKQGGYQGQECSFGGWSLSGIVTEGRWSLFIPSKGFPNFFNFLAPKPTRISSLKTSSKLRANKTSKKNPNKSIQTNKRLVCASKLKCKRKTRRSDAILLI